MRNRQAEKQGCASALKWPLGRERSGEISEFKGFERAGGVGAGSGRCPMGQRQALPWGRFAPKRPSGSPRFCPTVCADSAQRVGRFALAPCSRLRLLGSNRRQPRSGCDQQTAAHALQHAGDAGSCQMTGTDCPQRKGAQGDKLDRDRTHAEDGQLARH